MECLAYNHGIVLSLGSLRRKLSSAQLFRRRNHFDLLDVDLIFNGPSGKVQQVTWIQDDAFEVYPEWLCGEPR